MFGFSAADVARISEAVNFVERLPRNKPTNRRRHVTFRPSTAPDTVQVFHDDANAGEVVEANEANLHPGRIRRFDETMQVFDDVWIGFTDRFDEWEGDVLAVQEEFYGPGKQNGTFTVGDDTRPLYLVTHGARSWDAFAYDEIVAGEANLVEFMEWDEDEEKFMPTGLRYDAHDFFLNADETQEKGTKLTVEWRGPRLVITSMYCSKSDDANIVAIVGDD
ncbi:hypothetical protein [Anatilimnocola floriformis]|uniref:hypothetical protein n=1 Tax=Anatilimnocola floriformis TaxID=2948575 RepID=UPI0020C46A55|nr:hypothetical protein [Anatilimnocola floriformis]